VTPDRKDTMPTLAESEAALTAAHDLKQSTHVAVDKATADAAAIRAKVKAGGRGSAKITAADIAAADAAVEHARLGHEGAVAAIPALAEAAKEARANEACDEVVAELPILGRDVALALDALEEALAPVVAACRRYDEFVETAVRRLEKVAPSAAEDAYEAGAGLTTHRRGGTAASPFVPGAEAPTSAAPEPAPVHPSRFKHPRHSHPSVDGVSLTSCRGPSQLAAILVPAMRALGASEGLIDGLKLLAAGAPQLPTP